MCGIAGFVHTGNMQPLAEDIQAALATLAHRGPDDAGLYLDPHGGAGLGHRRLAVIDLSARGRQPMHSRDGGAVIVYNGEIYNFRELRRELETYGHRFSSDTDTEVVLNAYVQWGVTCLARFNGMFALAIWEPEARRLFLARDRHGIKPLYYYTGPDILLFASELKGLMACRTFPREVDSQSLARFLHYQYVPAPASIFRHTCKLPPGHFLLYVNGQAIVQAYWQTPARRPSQRFHAAGPQTLNETCDALDDLLSNAVSGCMISDAPLGAFLSGGIDSSLVVALMQKHSRQQVQTFSIGFSEAGYNEAPYARRIADHLGTRHTEFYVSQAEALQVFRHLPVMYDEPFADSSAIPTSLLSCLTRRHVTVALSGDGGDEQFCGYVRYWSTRALHDLQARWPFMFRPQVARQVARLPLPLLVRIYSTLHRLLPPRLQVANISEKLAKLQRLLAPRNLTERYRETIALWSAEALHALTGLTLSESAYEDAFSRAATQPVLSALMQVDQQTWLPDAMLTKVDRASMAHSLEVRVPLLDHRITEFAATLPESLLYHKGEGKYILKRVLARYVPAEMFQRPKMGFGIPLAQWLRNDLREPLQDYLSLSHLEAEGRFNANEVQATISDFMAGHGNHQHRLWALLMWEMWREQWLT